jgi:hypothetical protein
MVKVKLSLCLTKHYVRRSIFCFLKHHAMRMYWVAEEELHAFLTSAQDRGEWSASRFGSFTSGIIAPSSRWIGGWVDLRAGLDAVAKRKIPSLPLPGIETRSSS